MTNIENFENIKLEAKDIEVVTEYKYLGQMMSFENRTKNEFKIRRRNAGRAFWAQSMILKGKLSLKAPIRLLECTTFWTPPYGKRRVGRPSTRWADEIVGAAGRDWASQARQREEWADLVEAYTQEGALSEQS